MADGAPQRHDHIRDSIALLSTQEVVDFEVAYSAEPDFFGEHTKTFGVRVLGGYTISRSNTPRDGSKIELAGARSRPDVKVNVTANYRVGPCSRYDGKKTCQETASMRKPPGLNRRSE